VVANSQSDTLPGTIGISGEVQAAADSLRDFLFERVYTPLNEEPNTIRAQHIIRALFTYFVEDPDLLPPEHRPHAIAETPRRVADFIASTTDHYAIELYEENFVPRHWSV
jgi:dGTPase